MCVQVVFDNNTALSLREIQMNQIFHTPGPIRFRSPLCGFDMTPVLQRGKEHEQIGSTFSVIFIIITLWMTYLYWYGLACLTDQLHWGFIETHKGYFGSAGRW